MIVAIIALLILLGIADCVTTYIGLKRPNVTEANPVAAPVLKLLGVIPGMLALKGVCTAIIVCIVLYAGWWWLGALFCAGYVAVIVNNAQALQGKQTIF